MHCSPAPVPYRRRRPEQSVLHQVIRRDFRTFVAEVEQSGRTLPQFVVREFEKLIDCGILSRGFVRSRCAACGYDRYV